MLNIGPQELLLVLIVALVIVGPQRLPELARTIGKGLREFRKVQDEVRGMVSDGLGADVDEIRRELTGAADEVRKAGTEVTGGLSSARKELEAATDVKKAFPSRAHRTRRPAATTGPRPPGRPGGGPPEAAPPILEEQDGPAPSDPAPVDGPG